MNAAIDGREGCVGGIEPLCLEGTTWYFGFNYSEDLVLSPLFDDIDDMAAFAARHMKQTDGAHDADYWVNLIEEADGESGLAEEYTFTREQLRALPRWIAGVSDSNRIAAPLEFPYHVGYLLNAAIGEDRTIELEARAELDRLGLDYEPDGIGTQCLAELLAMATGEESLPAPASPRDLAVALGDCIQATLKAAPANWGSVLADLR